MTSGRAARTSAFRWLVFLGSAALSVEDLLELLGQARPHAGPGPRRGVVISSFLSCRFGRRQRRFLAVVEFVHGYELVP